MQIPLSRGQRPMAMILGGVAFGAVIFGAGPPLATLWDRPACGETVMKAVSTEKTVAGSYGCFDADLRQGLNTAGIDSDSMFAKTVGHSGSYHYIHKTEDGGYVYEYDRELAHHNQLQAALKALKKRDLFLAWAEITGRTQRSTSKVYTLYFDGDGKITAVV